MPQYTTAGAAGQPIRNPARFNARQVMGDVINKLGDNHRITRVSPRTGLICAIAQRQPGGGKGPKWKDLGGLTLKQMKIIVDTSHNLGEASDRVIQLIIHGNDTTNYQDQGTGINAAEVQRLVAETVTSILRDKLAELQRDESQVEKVAAETAKEVIEKPPEPRPEDSKKIPEGVRKRRKKPSIAQAQAEKKQEIEFWTERGKLLGYDSPPLNSTGHVDGRWKRRIDREWKDHLSRQAAETPKSA